MGSRNDWSLYDKFKGMNDYISRATISPRILDFDISVPVELSDLSSAGVPGQLQAKIDKMRLAGRILLEPVGKATSAFHALPRRPASELLDDDMIGPKMFRMVGSFDRRILVRATPIFRVLVPFSYGYKA